MYDVLVTIMATLDDEAKAIAFADDLERRLSRWRRLEALIEIRDNRRAKVIRKRTVLSADAGIRSEREPGGGLNPPPLSPPD